MADPPPTGFAALPHPGPFVQQAGPLFLHESGSIVGVFVAEHHLNRVGTVMGGFLATLVDVACCRAVAAGAGAGAMVATVSLTTEFIRSAPLRAWLEARAEVERRGSLAFADCSVWDGADRIAGAHGVFAVRFNGSAGDRSGAV
ncbi:MAG: thioesterase superfamily protein [Frankiales bacterium]|nr:thioesterase superfamily protein [Frankiales bacterium]